MHAHLFLLYIHRFEVALKQTQDMLLIPSQLPKKIPSGITVPSALPGGKFSFTINYLFYSKSLLVYIFVGGIQSKSQ